MGFSRQEYWSLLPFPSPGDLPNPGTEPGPPTLEADEPLGKPNHSKRHRGGSCPLPMAPVAVSPTGCGEHAAQAPESGWGAQATPGEEDEPGQVGWGESGGF